jgi:prophage regulatory protein
MSFSLDGAMVESGGPDDRLLPWERVQDIVGISRTTAWRMQQAGSFPTRVTVSPGRVGWWESELTAWKSARGAAKPLSPPSKSTGPAKTLTPPSAPRLPGTARRAPKHVAAAPAHLPPVQLELPAAPPPAPLERPKAKRRARPAEVSQIDFGF